MDNFFKNINQNLNFKKYKVDVENLDNPFTGKLKENIITYYRTVRNIYYKHFMGSICNFINKLGIKPIGKILIMVKH